MDELEATTAVCTNYTQQNQRNYAILLAFGLVMIASTLFSLIGGTEGQQAVFGGIGLFTGIALSALSGYMLLVCKNRQVVVGQEGIELTDARGRTSAYAWNDVRIVDNRTTSADNIEFKTRDGREEAFAPSCGGYRAMCDLLIDMGKLRRIDEAALAKKRKMKSLFDVVQGGMKREKPDESLYLPDAPKGDGANEPQEPVE